MPQSLKITLPSALPPSSSQASIGNVRLDGGGRRCAHPDVICSHDRKGGTIINVFVRKDGLVTDASSKVKKTLPH